MLTKYRLTSPGLALCKCGVDMVDHDVLRPMIGHRFVPAGTKYRCNAWLLELGVFCPRPRYHLEEGVQCGPLTGEKLW